MLNGKPLLQSNILCNIFNLEHFKSASSQAMHGPLLRAFKGGERKSAFLADRQAGRMTTPI